VTVRSAGGWRVARKTKENEMTFSLMDLFIAFLVGIMVALFVVRLWLRKKGKELEAEIEAELNSLHTKL